MELPIVNRLSGTMPSDLLEAYLTVKHSLDASVVALGAVWPHGRDYQGGSIRNAMHEHAERMRTLRAVQAEIEAIAESIVNQL